MKSNDKKIIDLENRQERIQKVLIKDNRRTQVYMDNEPGGYMIPENENEKTLKISQEYLKSHLPKFNRDNIFDLELNYGPYHVDFTQNGGHLLLGGEKGHISLIDWKSKNLVSEFRIDHKVQSVKFLQNETMFAVAQKDMLYIYDHQGIELHALDYISEPKFLEYLPYHYLLVAGMKNK